MAWNPNVPTVTNRVQDDLNAIRENFQVLGAHLADTNNPHNVQAQQVPYSSSIPGFTPATVKVALDSLAGVRIVERGSNANGEYVRWENGLQVCWTTVSETVDIVLVSSLGGYFTDGTAHSFPAAFAGSPVVLVTQNDGPFALAYNVSSSGYRVRYRSIASVSNWSRSVYVFAIGRWK